MRLVHLHQAMARAKSTDTIERTTAAMRAHEDDILGQLEGKALPSAKIDWNPQTAPRAWGGR